MLLRDISPLHAAILEGVHDAELDSLEQAINARRKRTLRTEYRTGTRVRIVDDPRSGDLAGVLGTVIKINRKSVSVDLDDGRSYRVSSGLLEVAD